MFIIVLSARLQTVFVRKSRWKEVEAASDILSWVEGKSRHIHSGEKRKNERMHDRAQPVTQ